MSKSAVRVLTSVAAAILSAASLPAFAVGAQRTFVASNGVDTNPCSLALPCRSFGAALAVTNSGGEVIVLDSAGYGPVTITQAVSIIAPAGIYAGVTATAGNGIVVNAPSANVVLRGLDINGQGTGASGILHQAAASLVIERCNVTGFAGTGIAINAGPATISDTVSKYNVGGGIVAQGTDPANFVHVTVVRSRVEGNGGIVGAPTDAGVAALGGSKVTVADSVAAGNFRGFSACNEGAGEPLGGVLSIDHSLSSRNAVGVFSGPNAVLCSVRVSNSTITDNTILGMEAQGGGVITSLGNNFVFDNAGGEIFGLTVAPK